jgi:hypothetical protein
MAGFYLTYFLRSQRSMPGGGVHWCSFICGRSNFERLSLTCHAPAFHNGEIDSPNHLLAKEIWIKLVYMYLCINSGRTVDSSSQNKNETTMWINSFKIIYQIIFSCLKYTLHVQIV